MFETAIGFISLGVKGVQTGLGMVTSGREYLDGLANKYVVKPANAKGIGGFVFDYEAETAVHLQADITDHYTEQNTPIQDHIALRPSKLTLRGFTGELALSKPSPSGILGALDLLQNKLTTVPAYLGKYTPGMVSKIQGALTATTKAVNTFDQALARVKNVVGMFGNSSPGKTKQSKAYQKLQSLFASRQVMVVETPYGMFGNMVIESLSFIQPESTKFASDISVTLKSVRFVNVQETITDIKANRGTMQRAPTADKGTSNGSPVAPSLLMQKLRGGP